MCNTDYNQDEQFRQILEHFLDRLVIIHGRALGETRYAKEEWQRAYREQKSGVDLTSD